MTTDEVLLDLARTDPTHVLVRPGERGIGSDWRPATDLADAAAWPAIARDYAADIGSSSPVVGGSCALQGYAWRIATLSISRWVVSGRGVPLGDAELRVCLRSGRTVGLAVGPIDDTQAPTTIEALAEGLAAHLAPIVTASRSTSRLTPKVAWGNVASAIASTWRQVHAASYSRSRPVVLDAARRFLGSPAWPWDDAPIDWQIGAGSLRYRRTTCCLIRLAPGHAACTSCSDLTSAQTAQRWRESERTRPEPSPIAVGAHVEGR